MTLVRSRYAFIIINLFGGDVGENDPALGNAAFLLGIIENVGLSHGRETKQPQNRVGHALQNAAPGLERRRICCRCDSEIYFHCVQKPHN